ncbi:hypothetical protein QBC45DRAFT_455055 [Copromyces sp. CBS 386.78]|nr:hypothetical protein QBC45DRAFT_455055 [Copromyces sp. CBS 386.78]
MSSPSPPSGAMSFIFTTTRGKRCTAILKAVQSSSVRTATGHNSRLPATTTTSATAVEATTTAIGVTTRGENSLPINASASPPPPFDDPPVPILTSTPSTSATTSIIPTNTSTSSPFLTSLGASIVEVTASEIFPDDAVATPFASTATNLQPSSDNNAAQATETPSIIPTLSSVPSTNSKSEAAKVAGGVLSGLVVLSLIGLLFWLWRRRRLQKRRSTSPRTNPDGNEKKPYIISRRSIGPTPVLVKAKAALGYNSKKIRERISQSFSEGSIRILSPSNRQQSQGLLGTHGRNPSLFFTNSVKGTGLVKVSISNWWSRITSHMYTSKRHNDEVVRDRYSDTGNTSERQTRLQYQPDFLTLIRIDEDDLGREVQGQQRVSGSRDKPPTTQLLHPDERNNPFRDPNTLSHVSAIPAPLAAAGGPSDNPFSDPVPRPPNSNQRPHRRPPPPPGNTAKINPSRQPSTRTYRESINSFTTHRNKFRSDPFDLERPELLCHGVPQVMASQGTATTGGPRHPPGAHTRQESLGGSSRYSYPSGVNDPGPDVGPASARNGGNGAYGRVRGGSVSVGRSGGLGFMGRAIYSGNTKSPSRSRLGLHDHSPTAATAIGTYHQHPNK